jgi:hemerythrin
VQHRQLFAMLNEYHRASTSEGDEALLRQTVGDLIDYTKIHFAFEETLLERNAYDGLEAHKDGHMRLAKQVHHFADAANFGAGLYAAELYFFLRTWLKRPHPRQRSALRPTPARARRPLTLPLRTSRPS